jgi:hypothetical protein
MLKRRPTVLLALVGVLVVNGTSLAHPGHDPSSVIALPAWHLSDGRTLSAYLMKAEQGRVWLVDGVDHTMVLDMGELDDAGKKAVKRTSSRLRILNETPVVETPVAAKPALAPSVLTALAGMLAVGDFKSPPPAAKAFAAFPNVTTRWDDQFLYVESNGLPDHPMMIGIKAWQQQVPLPQTYVGDNAWRIPLNPVSAQTPAMIKGRFLRGAIALAVNGIPIFNPQNNRGEISYEIGELDEYGGHCGRADDYHYHIVPLKLQNIAGKGMPLAYALDGYPIYGQTEPDGSPVGKLDELHGHTTAIGYHYHASMKYPYVIGGFHGQMVEREGPVDPQPRANPVRPALPPLRGAVITDFKSIGNDRNELTYEVSGRKGYVRYGANADGDYAFEFTDTQGQTTTQTYRQRQGGGAGRLPRDNQRQRPPRDDAPPATDGGASAAPAGPDASQPRSDTGFVLRSPVITNGGAIPREFTGDGEGISPPLQWSGAPAGTKSYALIMHHIPGPGEVKWYWTVWNMPADVHSLEKGSKTTGVLGNNSVGRPRIGYAPPHSKGPGAKTYILTLYALSSEPKLSVPPEQVSRQVLLDAIKGITLGSTELKFTYDRTDIIDGGQNNQGADRRPREADNPPPGPRGGGVHLIPRGVEEQLNLTQDQRRQVDELESETFEKFKKILTPDQVQTLEKTRPPRPDDQRPRPPG